MTVDCDAGRIRRGVGRTGGANACLGGLARCFRGRLGMTPPALKGFAGKAQIDPYKKVRNLTAA
jgi:hypothetical protein